MKDNRVLTGSLCALGCEVLYGLSYLFTKQTAETASPLALLGWRFVVALAAMSLCVALGFIPVRLKGRRLGPLLRVALFCPCLYFIGETVGIRETTVTESGVFLACVPALSLLASTVILKKKPTKRQIIGILVTFLGVMTTVVAVGLSSSLSPVGYAALMLAVVLLALFICALMHGWARKDGKIVLFAALSFAIGKGALAAVTAWYAQKGGVTFRANVSMWARLAMGMQESPIAAGWYNNYTERFFSADVTAEQEKAQALADIGAQLCRMRENPAAALAFYREKLLTQWLEPACDMLWSGQLSEKAGRYTGVIRGIYGAPGALRGWMEGYMDAMQTAVYALAAVGGVCALRKKGGAALLMIPVTVLGGALYHLIFEAKAQYAYPYMVYMLPLAAAGLCRLEDGAARLICSGKKWVQRRAECARTSHRD